MNEFMDINEIMEATETAEEITQANVEGLLTDIEKFQNDYNDAINENAMEMADYYSKKIEEIKNGNEIYFGGDTSESGWLHKADVEYAKNGDSRYYNYCLEQAAAKHRQ